MKQIKNKKDLLLYDLAAVKEYYEEIIDSLENIEKALEHNDFDEIRKELVDVVGQEWFKEVYADSCLIINIEKFQNEKN